MTEPIESGYVHSLNDMTDIINDWAISKGWNQGHAEMTPRHLLSYKAEKIALMHSELSECLEALRTKTEDGSPLMDNHVPSLTGEAAELADTMIRIFHYCGEFGIDIGEAIRLKHEFNLTRPYRHGKNA